MVEQMDSNVGVFARAWRLVLAAVLLLTTVVVGTTVSPVAAAGAATITKVLDPIQGAGYTAPNTFQTGANVRYRLTFQCSSLTTPCVTGTITDVLDPNLDFVQVIPPSSTDVIVTSSWDEPSRTVTVNLTSFDDGDSGEIVIVARVKGSTPGGTVIPNSGSITVPDGPIVTTPAVNIQVPGPTPSWGIIKNKTAPSVDPTVGADVTYRIDITASSPLGNVDISGGTVVDTYPAGATVVFSDGGVVDTVNHTITWTFGPIPANSLSCTLSPCRVGFKNIVLNYPAPSFVAGQTVTNYVQGNYDFANNTSGIANAQADVLLASATPVARFDKQGPVEIAPGAPILWTPVLVNQGNVVLHNVEIIDTLPANVTNFQLAQFDYRYFISPGNEPVVFDVFVGGVWQSLATYVASNGSAGFPALLPVGATKLRARVATLEPGVEIRIGLSGTASSVVGDTILNCATRTADEFTDTADACLTTTVVENFAKLQVVKQLKFVDPAATSAKPGDEFDWLLEVANKGGVPVTQIDIIDDLPPQFELLYTSCLGWAPDWPGLGTLYYLNTFTTCPSTPSAGAVTLVSTTPNVNANGDTRHHWRIDMTNGVLNPNNFGDTYTSLAAGGSVYLGIRVRVKPGTAVAQYTNNLQANTPDAVTICEANGGPDTTDVDGDGNTSEIMCAASSVVIIDEAAVVGAEKWDDGYPGLDHVDQSTGQPSAVCPDWGGYTRYPCVAQTVPNGPFDYKWKLQNYGNINLTNYVVYDVLPSVGDTGVSQLLGGQSRGTEWQPNLTGPVMIESQPAGANALVEYNLTFDPCRPEVNQGAADGPWQGSCDNTWYTAAQISDWSTVHSFRVKAFQETNGAWPAWLPAEEIILSAPMVAPSTAIPSTSTPLNLSIAWNSVAHRAFRLNADQSIVRLLAAEPRKVGIIIPFTENLPPTFRLGNLVWLDWNNNGVAEAGEAGIDGITVQLLDSVGAVIGSTVTAGGGKYLFSDLPAGDYSVRIPSGQVLLDGLWSSSNGEEVNPNLNGDNNDNGTIVNASGVTSGVITLGPTANEPTNETLRSDVSTDDDNDAFPDNQSNYSVDFGFTAVRLGNQVWLDNGAGANFDNGKYDTDETPISGVDVELWADDGDGIFEPGTGDTLVKSTTTDADGNYWFLAQPNTAYFVAIAAGQPELATLVSSTGANGGVIDNDDNGAPQATYASVSSVRSVSPGGAPTGEVDTNDGATTAESEANTNTRFLPDANSDLTIDFGFLPTQYDLALIKTLVTASPVQPGGNVEWTITVHNQGQTPSGDYTVTDILPGGMSFVSADNGGIEAGGVVSWDLSGLAPGESKALKLVSKVDDVTKAPFRNWAEISSDSGADDDSTPDTNTGSDTGSGTGTAPNDQVTNHNDTTFDSNAETPLPNSATDEDDNDFEDVDVVVDYDLALAKVTSASNVSVGANVTWTIRVQNQGNVASGVYSITDRIPGGMSFVSCAGATACSDAAGVVTYTMPNLAVGQFVDVTLVTKVDDMNKQPFRNWAEISADSGADDDSTPDINTGTDTGYGPAMGATDNGGANDLYVGIIDLNSLATDGPTTGFTDEDDHDDAIVTGAVHYDLALIKTVNNSTVVQDGNVVWTITVKNQGNVDSGPYSVTDTIPGGMSYVSSSPSSSQSSGIITWANQANLTPGTTTTFTLTTKADDLSKKPFRNWAEISADGADAYDLPGLNVEDEDSVPDTNTGSDNGAGIGTAPNDLVVNHNDISTDEPVGDEDDNDYEEVGGDVAYDLALVKVVENASPVQPGDTITWRIRVKNQGNVASGVYTITDKVPTGLDFGACTGGTACSQAAAVVTFTMASIAAGETAEVTYTTTITDVTKAPFRNWAEISADSAQLLYGVDDEDSTPDTNTGKDTTLPNDNYVGIADLADVSIDQLNGDEDDNDDAVAEVRINYDLALVKVLPAGQSFKKDGNVTFNIVVKNQGNVNSGAYSVQDVIPAGLTFVSASDNPLNAGQTVSWELPNLAPGEIRTLTLVVKIADITKPTYINFAEIVKDGSAQYGPGVKDKDSTPDADITNDQLVDNDDVNIDNLPGDEDDHDRAMIEPFTVRSDNPSTSPLPATGSDPLQLLIGGAGLLGIGLLAVAVTRRRRRLV